MINAVNLEGRTIVHISVISGKAKVEYGLVSYSKVVSHLLSFNPDITIMDSFSLTPSHYAAFLHVATLPLLNP